MRLVNVKYILVSEGKKKYYIDIDYGTHILKLSPKS